MQNGNSVEHAARKLSMESFCVKEKCLPHHTQPALDMGRFGQRHSTLMSGHWEWLLYRWGSFRVSPQNAFLALPGAWSYHLRFTKLVEFGPGEWSELPTLNSEGLPGMKETTENGQRGLHLNSLRLVSDSAPRLPPLAEISNPWVFTCLILLPICCSLSGQSWGSHL